MTMNDMEHCDFHQVHKNVVRTVGDKMPDEDKLYDLAGTLRVFGDSIKIKISYVLFEAEMCVCDIAQLLNMNQSAISHQLRISRRNRLVKSHRDGEAVLRPLADSHVRIIINRSVEHIKEQVLLQVPMVWGWSIKYK